MSDNDTTERQPNAYEQRQQARRDRLQRRAAAADAESSRRYGAAHATLDMIPAGQPILVGHHSEGRHRRDLDRVEANMRKGYEAAKDAERLASQAAAVGTGGISSDDPEALTKLRTELERCEAAHARMVQANKLVKKNDRAGLLALGFNETRIDQLFTKDFAGRIGFPNYQITNSGANIRRLKQRIEDLQKSQERQAGFEELTGEGWRIYVEDNRVCIAFEERQPAGVVTAMKSRGFKWSPSRNAWVRMYSESALYAAKHLVGEA